MAWTTISDATTASGQALTQLLIRALRDNITAAMNGDTGAPKLQTAAVANDAIVAAALAETANEVTWVQGRMAQSAVGEIGTYALMETPNGAGTAYAPGDTLAGSSLNYAGLHMYTDIYANIAIASTPTPAGTWRCMGYAPYNPSGGISTGNVTLWLRIS